jgi:hypothetical protein
MDMSTWRIKIWRWKLAIEKIEAIVDKFDGLATIDAVAGKLVALPGTKKYRKLYEKGHLERFIMMAIKQSESLKLVPYFDGSGNRKYIVVHSKEGAT